MIKRLLLVPLLLFLTNIYAQEWEWGKRGGSISSDGLSEDDEIYDMGVDRNGNVYILSQVYPQQNIDGHLHYGLGYRDVSLASFDCNGNFRWNKILGTPNGGDYGFSLRTDNIDGVYLSMSVIANNDTFFIDSDTSIAKPKQSLFLIKYDTSGSLQWARSPQPDTLSFYSVYSFSYTIDMDVDDNGNIFWLVNVPPGVYGGSNGFVTADTLNCILKYDRNGYFLGGIDIEADSLPGLSTYMTRDYINKRIYLAGGGNGTPIIAGNQYIRHAKFLICLDEQGKYLWHRENNKTGTGINGRPLIDEYGDIYLAGTTHPDAPHITPPQTAEVFCGYAGKRGTGSSTPIVYKLNKDGILLWAVEPYINAATSGVGVAQKNNGEVIMVGHYPRALYWASHVDSLNLPPNSGYNIFIARLSVQTGVVLGVDQLTSPSGTSEYATTIVADGKNSIYVGGQIRNQVIVAGDTLSQIGGNTDWFIAKYGHNNCNCTNTPEPRFTFTRNGLDVTFKYTGSYFNSIEYFMGDGGWVKGFADHTYTYNSAGIYTVFVKVTNNCGDNTYSDVINFWPTDISIKQNDSIAHIYPNPATDVIHINWGSLSAGMAIFSITDISGKKVYRSEVKMDANAAINISNIRPGFYFLNVQTESGINTQKLLIQ